MQAQRRLSATTFSPFKNWEEIAEAVLFVSHSATSQRFQHALHHIIGRNAFVPANWRSAAIISKATNMLPLGNLFTCNVGTDGRRGAPPRRTVYFKGLIDLLASELGVESRFNSIPRRLSLPADLKMRRPIDGRKFRSGPCTNPDATIDLPNGRGVVVLGDIVWVKGANFGGNVGDQLARLETAYVQEDTRILVCSVSRLVELQAYAPALPVHQEDIDADYFNALPAAMQGAQELCLEHAEQFGVPIGALRRLQEFSIVLIDERVDVEALDMRPFTNASALTHSICRWRMKYNHVFPLRTTNLHPCVAHPNSVRRPEPGILNLYLGGEYYRDAFAAMRMSLGPTVHHQICILNLPNVIREHTARHRTLAIISAEALQHEVMAAMLPMFQYMERGHVFRFPFLIDEIHNPEGKVRVRYMTSNHVGDSEDMQDLTNCKTQAASFPSRHFKIHARDIGTETWVEREMRRRTSFSHMRDLAATAQIVAVGARKARETALGINVEPINPFFVLPINFITDTPECWMHVESGLLNMLYIYTRNLLTPEAAELLGHFIAAVELPLLQSRLPSWARLASWSQQEMIRLAQHLPLILLRFLTPDKIAPSKRPLLLKMHGAGTTVAASIRRLVVMFAHYGHKLVLLLAPAICMRTGFRSLRDASETSRDSITHMFTAAAVQRSKLIASMNYDEAAEEHSVPRYTSGRMGELSHVPAKQVSKKTNWRDLPFDTMRRLEFSAVLEELTAQSQRGRLSNRVGPALLAVLQDADLMTNIRGEFIPRAPGVDGHSVRAGRNVAQRISAIDEADLNAATLIFGAVHQPLAALQRALQCTHVVLGDVLAHTQVIDAVVRGPTTDGFSIEIGSDVELHVWAATAAAMAADPFAAGRTPLARVAKILRIGNQTDANHIWVEIRRFLYAQHAEPLTQCVVLTLAPPAVRELVPLCALRAMVNTVHHCSAIVTPQAAAAAAAGAGLAAVRSCVWRPGVPGGLGAGRMREIQHAHDTNPRFLINRFAR